MTEHDDALHLTCVAEATARIERSSARRGRDTLRADEEVRDATIYRVGVPILPVAPPAAAGREWLPGGPFDDEVDRPLVAAGAVDAPVQAVVERPDVHPREETVSIEDEAMGQGDSPIGRLEEDRFRRRPFAEALGAEILAAPAAREHVMGLIGPCGSGKASILNMTADALGDQAIVVQFNPWVFFGTEVLDSSLFEEVGKQLDRRDSAFKAIAEKWAK